MMKVISALYLLIFTPFVIAEPLTCEALRAKVDERLQAKGVPSYSLEIIPASSLKIQAASGVQSTQSGPQGKEVGSCEGGTKRLIYTRF